MKIKLANLWRVINPGTTIRLWTIEGSGWDWGKFKSFWLKKNALHYKNTLSDFPFIDLTNELTGKTMRLKDNPCKEKPPTRYINV